VRAADTLPAGVVAGIRARSTPAKSRYAGVPTPLESGNTMLRLTPVCLGLLVSAIALGSTAAHAESAHLVLDSQPGDFGGGGKHSDVTYTPDNTIAGFFSAQIRGSAGGGPAFLSFDFLLKDPKTGLPANPDEEAGLDFSTQQLGIPIAPGTYTNAQRATF